MKDRQRERETHKLEIASTQRSFPFFLYQCNKWCIIVDARAISIHHLYKKPNELRHMFRECIFFLYSSMQMIWRKMYIYLRTQNTKLTYKWNDARLLPINYNFITFFLGSMTHHKSVVCVKRNRNDIDSIFFHSK